MAKAIPDRWLDYKPIGKRVPGTRFIAFKVPLHQHVNAKVKENLRLAPESLLESIPNLGLIIDLTNTNRYYHPSALTNHDVRHQKLMIPGKQTPNKGLAEKFCGFVADFLESNADNANWRTDVGAHTLNQSVIQSSSQPVSQLVFRLASEESPRPELSASREPGKQITYGGARSLVMPRLCLLPVTRDSNNQAKAKSKTRTRTRTRTQIQSTRIVHKGGPPRPDKLIGVHCTHGVNRTGYLICYFMISVMKKSPAEAIKSALDPAVDP
ncbi:hypothetical protein M5D96_007456 [Drosophila gunungcola]|uniref:Tyrosine specific protein phosphatases domain-containing protein n=1 Tax=Drosophila gunungcola TaxID=103775 RepID=A0A9P9YN76_9MUSC|nr:hypothetical protein M5D96_007456 [Drosophila gunungcola]